MTRNPFEDAAQDNRRADATRVPTSGVERHEAEGSAQNIPGVPRKRVFVAVLGALVAMLGYGTFADLRTDARATRTQQETINFVPDVETIDARRVDGPIKLVLPGQTEPFFTATLYPRATGYVAERRVDIGTHVRKGDLLVKIAAPDLDAQLKQATSQLEQTKAAIKQSAAQLAQAKANLALATITSKRYSKLTSQGYETTQNNDNQSTAVQSQQANVDLATASLQVAQANVEAQQATVERLSALVSYEYVRAPFDGVITTRGTEKGDLVNADNISGTPLFTIANEDVLRVTVHVPQADAWAIHDGLIGTAYLPQKPEQTFSGRIARSSVALLDSARILDTEVDLANQDGALKAGAYVDVTFDVPRQRPIVVLPAEALIFNQDGLQAAVVQDGRVRLRKLTIDRDLGRTVELRSGLSGGEQVAINPPPNLKEGSSVRVSKKSI